MGSPKKSLRESMNEHHEDLTAYPGGFPFFFCYPGKWADAAGQARSF